MVSVSHPSIRGWTAAYLLCDYLVAHYHPSTGLLGKRILELGSGAGLCGMVACHLGGHVLLTDRDEASVQLLRHNTSMYYENTGYHGGRGQTPHVEQLAWGDEEGLKRISNQQGSMDLVLASECIYPQITAEMVQKLFATAQALLAPAPTSRFLLSFIPRDGKTSIMKIAEASRQHGFVFEAIRGGEGGTGGGQVEVARSRSLGAVLLSFRPWLGSRGESFRVAIERSLTSSFPHLNDHIETEAVEWTPPFTDCFDIESNMVVQK